MDRTPFSVRNAEPLARLYAALGLVWHETNLQANIDQAQLAWLGDEHGKTVTAYSRSQQEDALSLAEEMGMLQATLPSMAAGLNWTYLIGATFGANVRRFELVRAAQRKGIYLGTVVGWFGQRLREERDGSVDDIVARLKSRDAALLQHPWVQGQLRLDDTNTNPWLRPFATEYELGAAAAFAVFGGESLAFCPARGTVAPLVGDNFDTEVPRRPYDWECLRLHAGTEATFIYLLNAPAERRKMNGKIAPSRHTTASCARMTTEALSPGWQAKIGIISGNPHTERTILDVERVFHSVCRYDLDIVPMGTAALESPRLLAAFLGEVARLLYMDRT